MKKDYRPFYGGVVILVAGAMLLALDGGWYNKIIGTLLLLFGVGLVCVGWSNENEK